MSASVIRPFPAALVFVGPALALFVIVFLAPFCLSVALSFSDTGLQTVGGGAQFVGMANYAGLLGDSSFWQAVARLLTFTLVSTLVETAIALTVAIYLDQVLRVPKLVEVLLVVPMFVIPVVSGLTFRYIFDPNDGVLGSVFGWFGQAAPSLLDNSNRVMLAVIVQDIWRMWPFLFLIIYAGLKSLPQEPLEAARLDGANAWQFSRYILLPMLKPTLQVAMVLKVIESLKAFTEIYVMTGGGPGDASELLSLFVVKQAFVFFRLGYGAAVSTLVLVLGTVLAATLLFLEQKRRRVLV